MESWGTACGINTSSFCRAWFEFAIRWKYPDWFGLTWSLELYQQTVARLWRQGQTAETVVVQHIITAGTIDEDVMKALANKDMTQNRLIAAVKARVTHGR